MSAPQGADERRIRHLLAARGVGYAPQKPPPVAGWWDDLYDDAHDDHHRPDRPPRAAPRLPDWRRGQTADLRGPDPDRPDEPAEPQKTPPTAAEAADDGWEDVDEPEEASTAAHKPRRAAARRIHTEYLDLPRRTRWLLYTGSAAGAGYWVGLVPLMNGWITACGDDTSPKAAIILGLGVITAAGVLVDRRTRSWWGPLPWLCRIPLASGLLALALYAPGVSS